MHSDADVRSSLLHPLLHRHTYLPQLHCYIVSPPPHVLFGNVKVIITHSVRTTCATDPAHYTYVTVASFQLVVLQTRVLFVQRHCSFFFVSTTAAVGKRVNPLSMLRFNLLTRTHRHLHEGLTRRLHRPLVSVPTARAQQQYSPR